MKPVQISDAAYERLQHLIAECDQDPRIPRAYSEADMLATALIGLEYLIHSRPDAPIMAVVGASVAKFELEKLESEDES